METRGRGRAARSDTQASRVRTRAQAAAEAAAASATSSGLSPSAPSGISPSRGSRKRTRPARRSSPIDLEAAHSSNAPGSLRAEIVVARGRNSKRARRTSVGSRGERQHNTVQHRSSSGSRGASSGSQNPRIRTSSSRGRRGRTLRDSRRGTVLRSRMDEDGHNEGTRNGDTPNSNRNDRTEAATLQGLLRTLGAGLDDMFPMPHASSNSRIRTILNTLRTTDNNIAKMESLTELCDYLSVVTEDTMVSFSVDAFVPPLVKLLSDETPDLKILSARAVTHLMDALPSASSSLSHHGASLPLCLNLLSIEYIDLAEQSLSALEKLSVDYPHPIVRAGGFSAALSFIDFFSTGVQRVAASFVCNLCRSPPEDAMDSVVEVLPVMFRLVGSEDQRIRESMIQGFLRLTDGFRGTSSKLERLCSENAELVDRLLGLVLPASPPALSPACFASTIRLLCTLVRGSAILSLKLLSTTALIAKMKERLGLADDAHSNDFLSLADALLPETNDRNDTTVTSVRTRRRRSGHSSTQADVDLARREALSKDPELLSRIALVLFEPLMRFFVSSADSAVRHQSLNVISKFLSLSSDSFAQTLIIPNTSDTNGGYSAETSFCHFVASLLAENSCNMEVSMGLSLTNSALQKVPCVMECFLREGVVHEMYRLADSQPSTGPVSEKVSTGNDLDLDIQSDPAVGFASMRHDSSRDDPFRTPFPSRQAISAHRAEIIRRTRNSEGHNIRARLTAFSRTISNQAISSRAAEILDRYKMNRQRKARSPILEELVEIQRLLTSACSSGNTESGEEELARLIKIMTAESGVTVYEFSRSSVVHALFDYLIGSPKTDLVRSRRFNVLVKVLKEYSPRNAYKSLVYLLNGSLSVQENFALVLNEAPSSVPGTSFEWGMRQLVQPMKLRLCRGEDTDSESLRDHSTQVVMIEPHASMRSIEEFLWPRVCPIDNARKRRSNTLRNLNLRGANPDTVEIDNSTSHDRSVVEHDNDGAPQIIERAGSSEPSRPEVLRSVENSDDDFSSESDVDIERGDVIEHAIDPDDPDLYRPISEPLNTSEYSHDSMSSRLAFRLNDGAAGASDIVQIAHRARLPSSVARSRVGGTPASTLRSYAAAVADSNRSLNRGSRSKRLTRHDPHGVHKSSRLRFSMNEIPISSNSTILNAVVKSSHCSGLNSIAELWNDIHIVQYTKAQMESEPTRPSIMNPCTLRRSSRLKQSSTSQENLCSVDSGTSFTECLESAQFPKISTIEDLTQPSSKCIALLSYLKWFFDHCDALELQCLGESSIQDFYNRQITLKMKRQVSDPIALCSGGIPQWCFSIAWQAPFLLPFGVRRILFQSTALGSARGLQLLQDREDIINRSNRNRNSSMRISRREPENRLSRLPRQKVRVKRDRLLESAMHVMASHASRSTILEVEYFDEVGTGLGPTLEFYTSASREVQRLDLNLWITKKNSMTVRESRSHSRSLRVSINSPVALSLSATSKREFAVPRGDGLYPTVLLKNDPEVLGHFIFLGRLVAKALADSRLLDLRLSRSFYELLLAYANLLSIDNSCGELGGRFYPIGNVQVSNVPTKIGALNSERIWKEFSAGRSSLRMLAGVDPQLANSMQKLLAMVDTDDAHLIATLDLYFTLPGFDSFELVPNGRNTLVTARNLREYVSRTILFFLVDGVRKQTESFIAGFSEVLDIRSLTLFESHEFEMLICGPMHENWTVEFLIKATRCDHGFRHESRAVLMLFKVLAGLNPKEQRQFVQFVTGSPALPLGGLCNLNPRLTIVKRTTEGGCSADDCLPTVMTCTNYLKLPNYSTFEIAKRQIMYAIAEGQGSFHLS